MIPVLSGNRNEHTISRAVQLNAGHRAGRYKTTLHRNYKSNRAAAVHTTTTAAAQQQQQYNSRGNSTHKSCSGLCDRHDALVFACAVFTRRCNRDCMLTSNHDYIFTSNFKSNDTPSNQNPAITYQYIGTPDDGVAPVQVATTPAIPSQPHPEGEPRSRIRYHMI